MAKGSDFRGLHGKIAGLKVKGMIEEVESRMANGLHVSAGPTDEDEAARLRQVKQQNQESKQQNPTPM